MYQQQGPRAPQPTTTKHRGTNILWNEINVNILMLTTNYSKLSIEWNSKYVNSTVPKSAMSTGNGYVL